MVPGLVPLGSALVQLTKTVFFTGKMLGSWLGSSWFRIGPTCESSVFSRQNAWFLARFQLVPHWSNLRKKCFSQANCLVPGSVPAQTKLAAGARVHAAQLPQGADIRHTPLMSVFMISDQRCEVVTNVQRLVTNHLYMLCGRSCLFSTFMYDFPDEHRREP